MKLWRLLQRSDTFDLIVCSLPIVETLVSCQLYANQRSVPLVIDVRDTWPDVFLTRLPRALKPVAILALAPYYLITRLCFRWASGLVAISPALLDWACRVGSRPCDSPSRVLTHGCPDPLEDFHGKPFPSLSCLEELEEDCLVVSFVGSFGHFYDLDTVLDTANLLRDDPRFQFVLAGDGPLLGSLQQRGAHLTNVSFTGWLEREEMNSLLIRSHIGLVPYNQAFLGNKVFEIMASGLPILATDTKDVTRLLERTQSGMTYPVGDSNRLKMRLLELYEDRERLSELAHNSRATYEAEFSFKQVYDRYSQFLEEMVEPKEQPEHPR